MLQAMEAYARDECQESVLPHESAEGVRIGVVSNDERMVGACMTAEAQFLT